MGFHKNLTGSDLHAPTNQLVENNSGSPIAALKGVKFTGMGTAYPQVAVANGDTDIVVGIAQTAIANGSTGNITAFGLLINIDTSAWAVGTKLYVDSSGNLSTVDNGSPIALVIKQHASTGILYIIATGLSLNIPVADSSTTGLLSSTDWISFNSRQYPVENVLYVSTSAELGPQDFNSIKSAVDSIVGNSASNPFKVIVGPGTYIEDTITMKPYVWVQGSEQDQTIIQVDDPSKHVIEGADYSGISKLILEGATNAGSAAVHYESLVGTTNTSFWVEDVRFGENDTLVIADGSTAATAMFLENCKFGGLHQFNHGFLAENGGRIIIRNSTTTGMTAPLPDFVGKATGTGSQIVINGLQVRSGGLTTGACLQVNDGGRLRCLSVNINGFAKGIWSENSGSSPSMQMEAILFENCTDDLLIEHPGTTGSFSGSADVSKVTIDPSSPIGVRYTNNANGGIGQVLVGSSLQGDRHDRLANLSKIAREATSLGVVSGGEITVNSGLDIDVAAGNGFLNDPTFFFIKEINWSADTLTIPANSVRYIFVDTNGTIQQSASESDIETTIRLGRVSTDASDIRFIESSEIDIKHMGNKIEDFIRSAVGPVFEQGCIVTENTTPLKLDVTAGKYYFGSNPFEPSSGSAIVWTAFYQNGSGGFTEIASQDTVSNTQYDDGSGTLASIPAGEYVRHVLYSVGDGVDQKYFLVFGQATFATETDARTSSLPLIPSFISDAVVSLAGIIVREGVGSIIGGTVDLRPRVGFSMPGTSSPASHGSLLGLLADDHPQYLLVSGTRAMTGNLDMGGQNITNVNLVDGVDVPDHSDRHLPNGADPLTTAAPGANLSATTSNAEGIANSMSRSDHGHAISTGTPSAQTPDQSNATGTSANIARADHIHNIPTAVASSISGNANAQGAAASFARSDHTHMLTSGSPSTGQLPQWNGTNWVPFTLALFDPSTTLRLYDDFIGDDQIALAASSRQVGIGWRVDNPGGASTATFINTVVSANHPGVLDVASGAAGGNYCNLSLNGGVSIILGGGQLICEYLIRIPTLATVTDNYVQRWGLGDVAGADQANGVYFEYDRAASGDVFRVRTASASTRTTVVTAQAVAASTWYKLRAVVNAAASSVEFFINGASVGTIATNIPTASISPFMHSVRTAGASRSFRIDYFYLTQTFTTPR